MATRALFYVAVALVLVAGTSASSQETSHWALDNNTTDSVGGRNGTLLGDATFSTNVPPQLAGYSTHSLSLDGTLDKMIYEVQAGDSLTGSFTVAMWFNPMDPFLNPDGWMELFGTRYPNDAGFDLQINRVHNWLRIDVGNGSDFSGRVFTPAYQVQPNQWHHVAATVAPASASVYIDGALLQSFSYPATTPVLFDSNHDIAVGSFGAGAILDYMSDFHGFIDDVHIFNNVLSAAEVQQVMTPGTIWNAPGGGNWTTSANWNPATVPNSAQARAYFGNAINTPSTIVIDSDVSVKQITFDNNAHSYTLAGDGAHSLTMGVDAVINVVAGSHTISAPVAVGSSLTKVGSGTLVVSNTTISAFYSTINAGTLEIIDNGALSSTSGVMNVIADSEGSSARVAVVGNGATWSNNILSVGFNGSGTLEITSGGVVSTNTTSYIGRNPGSIGTVTIQGAGSIWNPGGASIGKDGTGTLNITAGGQLSTGLAFIGESLDSVGTVIVAGDGSTFTATQLAVGFFGEGELEIIGGATASTISSASNIGYGADSTGTVVVSDSGTTWDTSLLRVGTSGSAILEISNGGMVSSTSATVGTPTAGNNATVTVEGLGSRWLMTSPTNTFAIGHSIAVGDSNGTVTIGSGGEISAAGPTTIYTNGRLTLNGGTFKTTEMNFQGSGQFEWTSGTLHVGTFNGDLTNSNGKLAPGNSPGITTINGDYVQGSDGVLEIEVGGTMTAGTDYDLVIVSDNAEIDGHLQVPIINGFMPQVGNRIRFLTADSITGTFSSISSPGLAVANPLVPVAIEVEVVDVVEDNTQAFEINFVAPRTNLVFDEDDMNEANWAAATTWTGAEPGAVPGTANVITIDNLTGAAQTVNVETEDAFVHSLEIASTSAPITVAVKEGFSLSAVTSVAIGNEAAVIIDDGRLVGSNISVEAGGLLAGNGTVVGNLVVGAGGGSDDAILRPGLSPGEFKVEGNYQQTADGTLLVEIDGIATEEFDRLRVSGSVALGGTLQIDASALTTASDGTTYEIITAGSLSGTFDTVESVGNDSIYFREIYDYAGGGFGVSQQARGDMNGIDDINSADYDLFVFALMNDDIAKWFEKCPVCRGTEELGAIYPQDGGDFSGNGIVDFDDIAHFQNQLGGMGMSSAGLAAAFERYFNHVPEPSSAMLVLCCGLMEGLVAGRGRRIMGVLLTGRLAFGRSRI